MLSNYREGEKWWQCRRQVNATVLKRTPNIDLILASSYEEYLEEELREWKELAKNNGGILPDVEYHVHKWSFEGMALFFVLHTYLTFILSQSLLYNVCQCFFLHTRILLKVEFWILKHNFFVFRIFYFRTLPLCLWKKF